MGVVLGCFSGSSKGECRVMGGSLAPRGGWGVLGRTR